MGGAHGRIDGVAFATVGNKGLARHARIFELDDDVCAIAEADDIDGCADIFCAGRSNGHLCGNGRGADRIEGVDDHVSARGPEGRLCIDVGGELCVEGRAEFFAAFGGVWVVQRHAGVENFCKAATSSAGRDIGKTTSCGIERNGHTRDAITQTKTDIPESMCARYKRYW